MKLYKVKTDSCTGTKTIAILEVNNRALLGSYFGYISICYINIETKFQFTSTDIMLVCDINKLTLDKIDNFLNDELSFLEKNIEPRLKISPDGVAYCLSAFSEYKFL